MARGPKKPKGGKGRGSADDPAFHKGHKPFSIARVSAPKLDARAGKVARWDIEGDIPEDEEDAFHRQRDVVLLDGGRGRGGGTVDEDDDYTFGQEEKEVMALRSPSPSDRDDSEEEDEEAEHHDSNDAPKGRRQLAKEKRAAGLRKEEPKRTPARLASPDSSDEALDDDDEGSGTANSSGSDGDDDQEDATRATRFGRDKRAYYSGDADLGNMDSDSELDEETKRELEVREAKRMQALAREGMDDTDFGLPPALSSAIAVSANDEDEKEEGKLRHKKEKRKQREEAALPVPQIVIAGIESGWQEKGSGLSSGSKEERERRRRELDGDDGSATTSVQAAQQDALTESEDPRLARERLFIQLEKLSPETIALSGEFADIVEDWAQISARLSNQASSTQQQGSSKTEKAKVKGGMPHIYAQVLNAYVTSLAFWLYIRSFPEYVAAPEKLREHPIMPRLLKFKKTLSQLEELGFGLAGEKQTVIGMDEADEEEEDELSDEESAEMISAWSKGIQAEEEEEEDDDDDENLGDLEDDELADLMQDEYEAQNAQEQEGKAKPLKSSAQEKVAKRANGASSEKAAKPKTKKGKKKIETVPAPLAELNLYDAEEDGDFASLFAASKKGKKRSRAASALEEISDADASAAFGEPTTISAQDLEEKAERKRSLKFYTSQISAKEARRGAAISKRDKLSGDADIPYRDKQASRDAVERARQAARQTGSEMMDTTLDGEEFTVEDAKDRSAVMGFEEAGDEDFGEGGAEDDGAEYYDLITSQRKAAKRQKKEEYDAVREEVRNAAAAGEDSMEPGTHRAINRQIEKNKGLAPYRPKAVRNPRVKKRQKYEKAKKKLGSMQAVYKGGLGALEGGYQGEKSGISSNVVKSRKFA